MAHAPQLWFRLGLINLGIETLPAVDNSADRGFADADELNRLARRYQASTLVILRRIFDAGFLVWADYRARYDLERERVLSMMAERTSGGNFYTTQPLRVSQRLARAIISDTLAGRMLHRNAYRLLGTRVARDVVQLGEQVGVA